VRYNIMRESKSICNRKMKHFGNGNISSYDPGHLDTILSPHYQRAVRRKEPWSETTRVIHKKVAS